MVLRRRRRTKTGSGRFEDWKTKFYALEGFSTETGWPTRKTLEEMELKKVADVLQRKDRLGA